MLLCLMDLATKAYTLMWMPHMEMTKLNLISNDNQYRVGISRLLVLQSNGTAKPKWMYPCQALFQNIWLCLIVYAITYSLRSCLLKLGKRSHTVAQKIAQ